ncbi:hypothetical protein [Croceicoccus mobilis]|uniref:Uncharacterized protein n=1 Tax=Croceicoccus mobilis TaxID=1703339 RepID=A0A916YR19_9SPHN|nr:hypothetical protein [Croceicoccus mobilis]GGD55330.1 hypothetical protein GCM10010990_00570 [Croceicoccus mobilis]
MDMSPLKLRRCDAFGEEVLDADLASILGDRTGRPSPAQLLHDWWHRPEVERIWQAPPSWRDNLVWYALAIALLQVTLFASLAFSEESLLDDLAMLASVFGA